LAAHRYEPQFDGSDVVPSRAIVAWHFGMIQMGVMSATFDPNLTP